jgi:hypothetical protein
MGQTPIWLSKLANKKNQITLGIALLIGVVQSVIYIIIVPPWQHYDEPGHFEYAWLIANHHLKPNLGDYDQSMRREVAASMIEYGFYDDNNTTPPDLLVQEKPIWIGHEQTDVFSIYYYLIALPMRIFRHSDVFPQLYLGRIGSVLIYIATIIITYFSISEFIPNEHPLRWITPLTLVLLPSFTDIMTSINNDVGATFIFSLFLWGGIRMVHLGFSWRRLFWLISTAFLCIFTKNTSAVALPLFFIPLFVSLTHRLNKKVVWGIITIGILIVIGITLTWDHPAYWYRQVSDGFLARKTNSEAPVGDYVFQIGMQSGKRPPQFTQIITPETIEYLREYPITVGAWMWADKPITVRAPMIKHVQYTSTRDIEIGIKPKFYAYSATIPDDISEVRVLIEPLYQASPTNNTIYYDGIIIARGEYPLDETPKFTNPDGTEGQWGKGTFKNQVKNGSAENVWPRLRKKVVSAILKVFPLNPSWLFSALLDWPNGKWYYKTTALNLNQTFWAKFGWGHISINGDTTYLILEIITLLGVVGALVRGVRLRREMKWDIFVFITLSFLTVWGFTIIRGLSSTEVIGQTLFIPAARYAFPAIIPTLLLLNLGWLEIMQQAERWLNIPIKIQYAIYMIAFLGLDILSIISIIRYYQGV